MTTLEKKKRRNTNNNTTRENKALFLVKQRKDVYVILRTNNLHTLNKYTHTQAHTHAHSQVVSIPHPCEFLFVVDGGCGKLLGGSCTKATVFLVSIIWRCGWHCWPTEGHNC